MVITRNLPYPSRFPQFAAKTKNVKSLIFLIYALNEINALLTLDTDFILHSETCVTFIGGRLKFLQVNK